ncbi:hypothetical protein F2Q70_00024961 [Brassica cretica]|uniref:Uncharacterized protein n=1 Tax=Brassica cretica TaxID=69181 RepID=A0A8S9IKI4_BRACR|nr:hypothetical protein F2Q68_00025025 [Brassica cretica]KAF2603389.1 hypothetical protein F2Q70_00024961 [Brassica cretica]
MSDGLFFAGFSSSMKLRMPRPCVGLSSPGLPGPVWGGVASETFPSSSYVRLSIPPFLVVLGD